MCSLQQLVLFASSRRLVRTDPESVALLVKDDAVRGAVV